MTETANNPPGAGNIGAPLPPEMAVACEAAGAAKARRDAIGLVVLGLLAGSFIAFGAMFMTVVMTGAGELPWGVARLLAGLVFSLGFVLVIVGGAELFTGDSLMIVACASRRITIGSLLRAWSLVYAGNICGAIGTATLVFLAGQHGYNDGAVGRTALTIASGKATLPTIQLFFLAVLCNVLVCLAVWMSFGARSVADKVMVIVPPITAFVAAGFEHSIANLFCLMALPSRFGRDQILGCAWPERDRLFNADRNRRLTQYRRHNHWECRRRQLAGWRGLLVRLFAPTSPFNLGWRFRQRLQAK